MFSNEFSQFMHRVCLHIRIDDYFIVCLMITFYLIMDVRMHILFAYINDETKSIHVNGKMQISR